MEEKNYSLLSADELVALLKAADPAEDLIEVEGELIKRIKSGECDVSVLDGVALPSMQEDEEESAAAPLYNGFILPGAYAFPSIVALVVMLMGVVSIALNLYVLVTGDYFTDFMSIIYYGFSVILVEFGKYLLLGLGIHLLADIAYNTFKARK